MTMRRRRALVLAVVASVGLLVSVATAWSTADQPPEDQVVARDAAELRTSTPRAATVAPSPRPDRASEPAAMVGRSSAALSGRDRDRERAPVPARLAMPSIGLRVPVSPVGVAPDGQMELPRRPDRLGWYRYGPAPTSPAGGSAVLAGHLDTVRHGLGPLVRLREAEPGDRVRVVDARGVTTRYVVVRIQRLDRQALPAALFSRSGPQRLRIITCGGAFDADAGGYQQNLVVTAAPVA
jgi:hypothetical protein